MELNIIAETRNHLVDFLKKVLEDAYTRKELESFIITGYQNEVFERIRMMVVEIIADKSGRNGLNTKTLSNEDRNAIEEIIIELERQST